MKALLLVDLQYDFFPGGTLAVKEAHDIIPFINQLIEASFDLKIASKDWHPADHASFAIVHQKQVGDHILLKGKDQILWPVHCVQGSVGANFVNGWNDRLLQKIVYKGVDTQVDSYSAFFDNEHAKSTGLHEYLQENKVKTLFIAGVATDYCVKFSVLDAVKFGYEVYVLQDACRGVDLSENDSQQAFDEMQAAGASRIDSQQAIKLL